MASAKTKLTELGTAVGLADDPGAPLPDSLDDLEIPGIGRDVWHPPVKNALSTPGTQRDLVLTAIGNGRDFRRDVLGGRRPERIDWSANQRSTWVSDVPRDITVDSVYFIQAKYDSRCVLNTSPANLVEELLGDDETSTRGSWFVEVAEAELNTYYREVRNLVARPEPDSLAGISEPSPPDLGPMPDDIRDLDAAQRSALRSMLAESPPNSRITEAYARLCEAVSEESARRWQRRLRNASAARRTQMLFRMLRIAGGPYWLLGTRGAQPVQLGVADTRSWRERFELKRFDTNAGRSGQPTVNWRAVVRERSSGTDHTVEGICEIRWSHGKFSGNPECKVQVETPLGAIPGYSPMSSRHPQ